MSKIYDWIKILGVDHVKQSVEAFNMLHALRMKYKTFPEIAKTGNFKKYKVHYSNIQRVYYYLRNKIQREREKITPLEPVTLKANHLQVLLQRFYPRLYKYAKSKGYSDSDISKLIAVEKQYMQTQEIYLDMTRATKPNFIRYMLDRKAYFEDLTGIKATRENVELYFDWLKSKNLVAKAYQEEPFRRNRRVA